MGLLGLYFGPQAPFLADEKASKICFRLALSFYERAGFL